MIIYDVLTSDEINDVEIWTCPVGLGAEKSFAKLKILILIEDASPTLEGQPLLSA